MNKIIYSVAVAALISNAAAIKQKAAPDVYGPNGEGYTNTSPNYDVSRIGIDIQTSGSGPKCKVGDWTTVHWSGKLKDGREITNSRAEKAGLPKTFALGSRDVLHCWDLAIPQLHQGDIAHISCPSYFAYGGAYT